MPLRKYPRIGHVAGICPKNRLFWTRFRNMFVLRAYVGESATLDCEPTRALQLRQRLVRSDRLPQHRFRLKLRLRRQQRKIVVWLVQVKGHQAVSEVKRTLCMDFTRNGCDRSGPSH